MSFHVTELCVCVLCVCACASAPVSTRNSRCTFFYLSESLALAASSTSDAFQVVAYIPASFSVLAAAPAHHNPLFPPSTVNNKQYDLSRIQKTYVGLPNSRHASPPRRVIVCVQRANNILHHPSHPLDQAARAVTTM